MSHSAVFARRLDFFFFQLTAEGGVNCCALAGMIVRLHVADDGGLHCFSCVCLCVHLCVLLQDLILLSCTAAVFKIVITIKVLIVFLSFPVALRLFAQSFGRGRRPK